MCGLVVFEGKKSELADRGLRAQAIAHRGPDDIAEYIIDNITFLFFRLAIMDLSPRGNQPFVGPQSETLVCNGEIYNFKTLKKNLTQYSYVSDSDCEVILPLYKEYGLRRCCELLDGEYAFVLYDPTTKKLMAARDSMGIRPLFMGFDQTGKRFFASEVKALKAYCSKITPFPPGHYYDGEKLVCYKDLSISEKFHSHTYEETLFNIRTLFEKAVAKRLVSDASVAYLLSGGLDSSLVCSIATRLSDKPLKTFAVGMEHDAIDLKYARQVADFIGSDHEEIFMTREDVLTHLREVIYQLETWDITTIRASIGMFLLCKGIRKKGPYKVLLTGEVSDELFGYKYTDFAPTPQAFQDEASKRIKELYLYDVLRADRCLAAHSFEARVPFSDTAFVEYVMGIDPTLKMNTSGMGKFLLRKSFEDATHPYLPSEILWRQKAAFSDAVGHSMVDDLKMYAENLYTDKEFLRRAAQFEHARPFTKESLLYREIFEEFYPGQAELIKDFWMPNKQWEGCNVSDPSARILSNYGASGL